MILLTHDRQDELVAEWFKNSKGKQYFDGHGMHDYLLKAQLKKVANWMKENSIDYWQIIEKEV